jgi:hypothetical protein
MMNDEWRMTRWERFLTWVLRVSGVLMLLALVAVVMPQESMSAANRALLGEELPDSPIVWYLTRSVSLLYAAQGAVTLYLSFHVRRYLSLLVVQAWVAVVLGVSMLLLDLRIGMPALWVLVEGPWIVLLGLGVLWLIARIRREEGKGKNEA